jgi:uncharacterized RDD family membrane protein YckC
MAEEVSAPLYATFPRRVRALVLDGVIVGLVLIALIVIAGSLGLSQTIRVGLFAALVAAVILYEPILVAFNGRTWGHALCNLRVVAATRTGRLPLWKAFLRWLLKAVTGFASFATMGATRRNQALHDLAFGTTVQIADVTRVGEYDFIRERPAEPAMARPGRIRRLLVIGLYLILLFVGLCVAEAMFIPLGCLERGQCETGERLLYQIIATAWLAASIAVSVFGWQGKLFGARGRARQEVVE